MFTATLVMQFADEGRVSLDTPVRALLADHDLSGLHVLNGVDYGHKLTVRHLIHQTSGLADYYEGGLVEALKRNEDRAFDLHDVLEMTRSKRPQAAPGGDRSYYSDTNYQLLGAIISAVSGAPFARVLQARICEPLGLRDTWAAGGPDQAEGNRPLALYHKGQPLELPLALASMGPDGGIVSTTDDLLRFLRAHLSDALLSDTRRAAMRRWTLLFFPIQYGFGLMRFQLPRWMSPFRKPPELIGHSGSSGSFAFYAPRQDIYLVGTFNQIDAPRRPFGLMLRVLRRLETLRAPGGRGEWR